MIDEQNEVEPYWNEHELPLKRKRRRVYDDINTSYFDEGGDEDDL